MRGTLLGLLCALPSIAHAFCGFYVGGTDKLYNNATQVVLMRDGTKTVLSMQNNYDGPPEDFAMIVPVPVILKEEDVKTLDNALFKRIDLLGSPGSSNIGSKTPVKIQTAKQALVKGSVVGSAKGHWVWGLWQQSPS